MAMTTWRIYSADIEKIDAGYNVVTYNMIGRKVEEKVFTSLTGTVDFLMKLRSENDKFQFTEI